MFDFSGFWNQIKPIVDVALPAAVNYLGGRQQAKIAKKAEKKEDRRWDQYLNSINPPQDVLDTRFAAAKNQIVGSAPTAMRRVENTLASRGIKGKGAVSPISDQAQSVQDALNQAYFQTYGNYNVPARPGPASVAPSGNQLFAINAAKSFNELYPYYWLNNYGG